MLHFEIKYATITTGVGPIVSHSLKLFFYTRTHIRKILLKYPCMHSLYINMNILSSFKSFLTNKIYF